MKKLLNWVIVTLGCPHLYVRYYTKLLVSTILMHTNYVSLLNK